MPATKHRRRGKQRPRDKNQGSAKSGYHSSPEFTEKGLLIAALLAQQFGTVRPTEEALAEFIAETPLLQGYDPETALVLWALAIHAVEQERPELLAELNASENG